MKAVVQWVLRTMMKDQTGIVRTMPKKDLVDFNVAMTAERLMRNGIDPNALKNANQVENAINQIEAPRNVQQGIKSAKSAKVMDMEGKEIDPRSKIMGGKQAETEAEILARINKENKKGIAGIKNKRQLTEDEYQDFLDEIGGADQLEAYNFDGTVGDAKRILKEQKDYMSQMEMEFRKGKLDPEPGSRTPQRKRFLQKKLEEAEASGDARLLSREEREELFDLDDIPEYATGGRAGFKSGSYLFQGAKKLGKKYKGSTLEALLENPKLLGTELSYEGIMELLRMGGMMQNGGRAGFKVGGIDKARRAFLKAAAGIGGGIAALKTGLLSIGKGADTVKNLPPIKTPVTKLEGTTTEMPDWFPSFVNKFRDEGKATNVFKQKKVAVSKAEYDQAAAEGKLGEGNYFMDPRTPEYIAKNPDHSLYNKLVDTDERIFTTYTNDKVPGVRVDDMDGNVDVMFENDYSQPVSINYTAPGKRGPETGRADLFVQGEAKIETKPKGEFVANDVEAYATDPDGGFDTEDVIANTLDDMMEGKTRQMEEYVTGKKTKLSKGEGRVIEGEIRAEQAAEEAAEAAADDFASGGIARMLGE